jgi:hypothetical protein
MIITSEKDEHRDKPEPVAARDQPLRNLMDHLRVKEPRADPWRPEATEPEPD